MKKTQKKIVATAIDLFNKGGVGNVRLQDIAKGAGISQGNLSYHYKTKKDLMEAVLAYMNDERAEMRNTMNSLVATTDVVTIINNYLRLQIGFRFFYRDILEIIRLVPKAKKQFEKQIKEVINFNKNAINLSIQKGFMIKEPHEGHYDFFVQNIWAILNSWLTKREVLGNRKVSLNDAVLAVLEMHFLYLTKKGKVLYYEWKEQIPKMVRGKMIIS